MKPSVIARDHEISMLDEIYASQEAEFFAVYGRRRVGKTYLINQYFKDKDYYFELTGRKNAPKLTQLQNFSTVYSDMFERGTRIDTPNNWDEAFDKLRYKIEEISEDKKIVLFFDELPWLASRKSGFLDALDLFWNRYASRLKNVILIVCGSAAAWMIKKAITNKAGLHNRLTRVPLNLKPFNLKQTEEFLKSRDVELDRKQLIDVYMALGGIPYYLKFVQPGKSSAEIINYLFFDEYGILISEFHKLFSSLFENYQKHIAIIKLLAKTKQGLTQQEIFSKVKVLTAGGGAVAILQELEHCGFIMRVAEFGKKKKETRYRLIDQLSLFYLSWVEDTSHISNQHWAKMHDSPSYKSWAGYAFENICFLHYQQIIKALELTVTASVKSSWKYIPPQGSDEVGVQIDLIVDRTDKCINLFESKFYDDEFVIDKTYAQTLRRKKACFRDKTGTKKTLFLTMITVYGAKKNQHYLSAVDQQLTGDDLFSS